MFRGFLGSFLENMMQSHRSNIESLLDKEDTQLETLLEDSEILTQCKWGNQRLVNYFDHDKVSQLIDYIISMPPEGCSHDRGHKLPFIASEIFNCELNKINDIFFQARPQKQLTQGGGDNTKVNKKGKNSNKYSSYQQQSDEDDEDDHNDKVVGQSNNDDIEDDEDHHMTNQDESDDFEKLIASDSNNNHDDNSNDVDGSHMLRKSFGETRGSGGFEGLSKPTGTSRSNRYEVQDYEEVDQDEIELRTDETIDGGLGDIKPTQVVEEFANKLIQEDLNDGQIEIIPDQEVQEEHEEQKQEQQLQEEDDIASTDSHQQIEALSKQVDQLEEEIEQTHQSQQNPFAEEQVVDAPTEITDNIQENYIQEQPNTTNVITDVQVIHNDTASAAIEHVEDEINLEDYHDDGTGRTMSTAPTTQQQETEDNHVANEFELFEKLLSFLDSDEQLNPVLTGYFCKLFQVLVGNKPKEVFGYIYSHLHVLDNFVKHLNDKSISEILIRLLNVSENVLDDGGLSSEFDGIRQSYIYKIVEKLSPQYTFEDHLNAQSVLSDLVEYKLVYTELTSQRCLDVYNAYLSSEVASTKAAVYQLLRDIATKYKSNEHFSKRVNISNFQDCGDDMMLDDEEDVLVFNEDKESAFFGFVKKVIAEHVARELAIPHEDDQEDLYPRSYGICKEPFGMVRIRAVEFLAQVYQIFFKDIHQTFAEADLYNALLFFFDHYPFHNVLHQQVSEIFTLALDKNNESVVNHFLYQTSLIKKILDTSRDGGIHTFMGTGQTVNRGFMAFMRKLANKLDDLAKKNEEVQNFLESIPEWADFQQNVLAAVNAIESKPLGSDPRKKDLSSSDDYFDMIYKLKDSNRSGFQNKSKKAQTNNDNDNDDEEEEEEDEEVQVDDNDNKAHDEEDEEDEDANRNKDLYFSNELGAGKSRNKRNKAYQNDGNDDEEEEESDFDRLIYRQDDDDNAHNNDHNADNNDLQQYFSNGDDQTKKPWDTHCDEDYNHNGHDEDEEQESQQHQQEHDHEHDHDNGLSMNDLVLQSHSSSNSQEVETPKFAHEESPSTSPVSPGLVQIADNTSHSNSSFQGLKIVEANVINQEELEVPFYHSQFFWKDNLTTPNEDLDALLQDYE